jgi:putative inorganic carbon (HCO3(-)) transporter
MKGAARWIAGLEPGIVILAAPFLLFPAFRPAWTAGALVVLLLAWLSRWFATGRPGPSTPMDVSLLVLLLMVPVAVWASAMPDLTLPKLTGLILGVAAFRATVHIGVTLRKMGWAVALFLLLGLGLAMLGLLGTRWSGKVPGLDALVARIPLLVQGLPGAEAGINVNELGGTLLLFLPVALAATQARGTGSDWLDWVIRFLALLLTLLFGALLLLTQSRSAWLGAAVALATMAWLRWRWMGWLILGAVLLVVLGVWYLGPAEAAQVLVQPGNIAGAEAMVGTVTLEGRVELWNRALYAIQDFPFTGCGLGTFRQVVHLLYPLFLTAPETDIAHAHNIYLQVALDLGLPGLVAYLALAGTALWIGWRLVRPAGADRSVVPSRHQWLAYGIVGSLIAFHVYGLTDAIALGAKPGVALWMLFALAVVLWRTTQVRVRGRLSRRHRMTAHD